jgi:hypothetical protein
VEKVVLFGSVACPLREEKPRYRQYRRAGELILHECKDIDLAVWLSDSDCLRALQKARSKALNKLWQEQRIGVAHHQVDIFIMEPGSDRYLERLCSYNQCPKGKPECRVTDCGSTPLVRQHEDFKLHTQTRQFPGFSASISSAIAFGLRWVAAWFRPVPQDQAHGLAVLKCFGVLSVHGTHKRRY